MSSKKIAYITGASRGIGERIAKQLAAEGFAVGLLARSANALSAVRDQIVATGQRAEFVAVDLTSPEVCSAALADLQQRLGPPKVLIHNAGWVYREELQSSRFEDCESVIKLNLLAPIQITRELLPTMISTTGAHIIFISSISGKVPLPGGSVYAASKFGLSGFAESLYGEVRKHGIRVTTIFPGSVSRDTADQSQAWKLDPQDIAEACSYALSQPQGSCVSQIEVRPLSSGK